MASLDPMSPCDVKLVPVDTCVVDAEAEREEGRGRVVVDEEAEREEGRRHLEAEAPMVPTHTQPLSPVPAGGQGKEFSNVRQPPAGTMPTSSCAAAAPPTDTYADNPNAGAGGGAGAFASGSASEEGSPGRPPSGTVGSPRSAAERASGGVFASSNASG
eukprot:CAMPEP_0178419010 /NCGR_PEP_ID=MMETSP0689_2-20121128/25385_1 /TAXON_ID=160604 /ORGANISM="Amphidinium massartii, Strain CS-259" /LENGTH=158 /DNA_ID=CAMNT_0020040425 /DNA_START=96 /DNA_END=568 /DNA_ORIENTATION=-